VSEERSARPWAWVVGCVLAATLFLLIAANAGGSATHATGRATLFKNGAYQSAQVTPAKLNKSLRTVPRARHVRAGGVKRARASTLLPAATEEFTQPNPNFDGMNSVGRQCCPPDANGDVGPSNYIQAVNSAFQIFNKQGVSLAGPTNINQLWVAAGQNNACSQNNNGDPVVVYDNLADRWLVSQFAVPNGLFTPPTFECIAISQTANPVTGGWFLYQFQFPFGHDYPKIGVWPDGYYMSDQQGFFADTTTATSVSAIVFDRANMLAGNAATFQRFAVPGRALTLLPSDLDGPAPPAGTPNFYARAVDGGLWGGTDRIDLFAFSVNWGNPAASTFTALPSLPTAASDQNLCGARNLFDNCVPQPGTGTLLETLPHWSLGHLQYRNFGTRETLVFNHTVDADGADHAGIQWFELNRPPGGAWSIFQQGTHSPDAGNPGLADDPHRWMGSIAMDKLGDLALGYSVSSSTVFPGIAYTGRQVGDPLGQMTQPETTLVSGSGSQTANTRWGDYSSMTVDPVDDCRFWYTSQYIVAGGSFATRIGAFRFSACDVPITATGTTISATEGAPFSGTVASFTDPDTSATAGEYTATIDWGDSSLPTTGTISGALGGPFSVGGSHTYQEEGTYTITVTISDVDTPSNTATALSTANVADAPLAATCTNQASSQAYSGVVASFTDANPFATTADFTATIDWGDMTPPTAGTVTASGSGFVVNGTHTFTSTGPFTVKATIIDDGGSTAATSCIFLIGAVTIGGSFVIGDLNATVGDPVTFWGAQWSQRNRLSGGSAPSAFKGFANHPSTNPACGQAWTTDPGNSSGPPPPPLPAFIVVRVASSISKSGSTISGNTPRVAIVRTDPGYDGNPGHSGDGMVAGIVC
jgi:hypothetical protein